MAHRPAAAALGRTNLHDFRYRGGAGLAARASLARRAARSRLGRRGRRVAGRSGAAPHAARLTMAPDVLAPPLAGDPPTEVPDDVGTPAAAPLRGLSVLVAEDNEINALLMRSLLNRLGHHAVIATNGEAALESWLAAKSAGTPYDLVLMDIQMSQLDGIETTRRIRSLEAGQPGRHTPILALTANTLVEDRYACFEAGMDGFLIKPLDREKLADALAGLAASRHIAA